MNELNTREIRVPEIERIEALEIGTVFFKRRDSSVYVIVGKNCHVKKILENDKVIVVKNPVVAYSLSLNIITILDGGEWVVLAQSPELIIK